MSQKNIIKSIEENDWLGTAGDAVQPVIIKAFKAGGDAGQQIKDALHGTWLGHPLHPAITDVPIGAWSVAAALDTAELSGSKKFRKGADAAVVIGIVGALGAAVTGITDWTGTTKQKRKVGLMHGLLNVGATALYTTSYVLRKNKKTRKAAIGFSMAGYGMMSLAAYLGGHLVYGNQVGVDHTAVSDEYPEDFVAVLDEKDLAENAMKAVKVKEISVLLAKQKGEIYAIANTCTHLGAPLDEGELLPDCKVICPWHDSIFSLKDGCVVNGPATQKQPKFDVRIKDGQIEVRKSK